MSDDDQRPAGGQADENQIAELALAVLAMRVNTPAGQWVGDTFGDEYYDIWREAQAIDGEDADENMFLSVVNMATLLVQYLTQVAPGTSTDTWLSALRADYVDTGSGA